MTICFSLLIVEFMATTWSKTNFRIIQPEPLSVWLCFCRASIGLPPCISWDGFFCSFFFFKDIVVILSMFPDIPVIARALQINNVLQISAEAIMCIRTLRLFRIIKVYKHIRAQRQSNAERLEILKRVYAGEVETTEMLQAMEERRAQPSKLGEKLTESTTTRVIFLIVILLVIVPLLVYNPVNQVFIYSTSMLQSINKDSSLSSFIKNSLVSSIVSEMKHLSTLVLYLDIFPFTSNTTTVIVNNVDELNKLRDISVVSEYASFYNASANPFIDFFTSSTFSRNQFLVRQTKYFLLLTLFSGIVALVASFIFTRQTENYVLKPIEVSNLK